MPMDLCISDKDTFISSNKVNGRVKNMNKKQNTLQYIAVSSLQYIYILDSESL